MESLIKLLSNPIIWGVVLFIAGVILKKKLNSYLKIISLLIDAIEVVDKEIKDVIPSELEKKLIKIKQWILIRIEKAEGKIVDNILLDKGYFKKGL